IEGCLAGALVALGPEAGELLDLPGPDPRIVDLEDVDLGVSAVDIFVDADDRLLTRVDARLGAGRRLFDAQFRDAGFDGLRHAPHGLDLLNMAPSLGREIAGKTFDEEAAAPRIDDAASSRFLLKEELRV